VTTRYIAASTDGLNPSNGLMQGQGGNSYGVTVFGGHNNCGTIFRITPGGEFTTLYSPAGLFSGYAGLYQIAIQIPTSLESSDYPVVGNINGASSPSTTMITVQQ
jgi:uncharacterized repeat protein (TIGR03803 family)